MVEINYTCKTCKIEFASKHKRMFCSYRCRRRDRTLRRNPNAKQLDPSRKNVECTCMGCGKVYMPKTIERNKYCSRECAYKNKAHVLLRKDYKPPFSVVKYKDCVQCGKPFRCDRLDTKTCSDECRKEWGRKRSYIVSRDKKDVIKISCARCGSWFTNDYGNKRRKYCSDECRRSALKSTYRHVRRARIKGNGVYEVVNPFVVFKRDGYKCKLCGVKTPLSLRGTTHDNAPELDHIITLHDGGEHSYTNTQCACRKCNMEKGSVSRGQMILFG